ncbi:MAG: OmpA family protein [Myxococcales bacterium]|nr:OmpA family protein [Myxococcales bacterium]MCB9737615.1 OmpA family protein [Deltaproteobacteria bacterium]
MNTPAHRRLLRHAVYASLLALPFVAAGACASSDTAYDYQAEQAPLETATGPASWPTTHVLVDPSVRDACGVHEANAAFELDTAKISDTANRNLGDLADCLKNGALRGRRVELVAYADPRSAAEYDTSMAAERAQAVAAELSRHGVESGCVQVQAIDPRLEDIQPGALTIAHRVDVRLDADELTCR